VAKTKKTTDTVNSVPASESQTRAVGRFGALIRKELHFYLNSAVAWTVVTVFLIFSAVWFFDISKFLAQNVASFRAFFVIMPFTFIALIPAITMRSWSEELRVGTYEVLLTMPYSQIQLVIAKFVAAMLLVVAMLVLSLVVPITVGFLGRFDVGIIVTEYLGVLFLAATEIALGMFISSLTKNQIVAFLGTMVILLFFTLLDALTRGGSLPDWLVSGINFFALNSHFESFVKGILDTRDLIFFIASAVLFLFLCERRLVLRKWR